MSERFIYKPKFIHKLYNRATAYWTQGSTGISLQPRKYYFLREKPLAAFLTDIESCNNFTAGGDNI